MFSISLLIVKIHVLKIFSASQKLEIHLKMKEMLSQVMATFLNQQWYILNDRICEDKPRNCLFLTRMSLKIALTRETELELFHPNIS